ncbi:NUMOD4 domain-containing protein [Pediococcus pentosaceus]|uniref:NUMOD4 domain-containing protein n=1 Tax=Pediococcus pentosaceus TaxID=1255 RepID=UPI003F1EB454
MEEWRSVKDCNQYEVSNLGRVKSLKYGKERILKGRPNQDGYLKVVLYVNGVKKSRFIHRLVASAFLGTDEVKTQVNHKDENVTNNCIENLEWVTPKENCNWGTRTIRSAQNHIGKGMKIKVFDDNSGEYLYTISGMEQMKQHGFNFQSVYRCLDPNDGYKKHHGCRFEKEEKEIITV